MKSIRLSLLFVLLVATFLAPISTSAAEKVTYPFTVKVYVQLASSFSITTTGEYQLVNNDFSLIKDIPSGTTLTVKKTSGGVNVSFIGFNDTSVKGFDLEETLSNTISFVKFTNGLTYRGGLLLRTNGSQIHATNVLDMEDYLKGVIPNEMPASWPKEALKSQAIAARSYATTSMTLSSTAASQVYRGYTSEDSRTNAAITETSGKTVKYNGKTIQAFFFSTSGGRTANVSDVWNSSQSTYPYLVSVEDPYENVGCANNAASCSSPFGKPPYGSWSKTYTAAELLSFFGFTDPSVKVLDLTLGTLGQNGEVKTVTLRTSAGDKTLGGDELKVRKLFQIPDSSVYNALYSNWFTAKVNGATTSIDVRTATGTETTTALKGQTVQTASGTITLSDANVSVQTAAGLTTMTPTTGVTSVTLTGKGWGHRVGMSQYGARGFALMGWNADQILTYYFKGTTVSN